MKCSDLIIQIFCLTVLPMYFTRLTYSVMITVSFLDSRYKIKLVRDF